MVTGQRIQKKNEQGERVKANAVDKEDKAETNT